MLNYYNGKWFEIKNEKLLAEAKLMTPSRIKSIRAIYKLTQENFANLLDISYNTYRNWEIGHRNPSTSGIALLVLAEQKPQIFKKKIAEKPTKEQKSTTYIYESIF